MKEPTTVRSLLLTLLSLASASGVTHLKGSDKLSDSQMTDLRRILGDIQNSLAEPELQELCDKFNVPTWKG